MKYKNRFLNTYRSIKGAFIRPKIKLFIGKWRNEHNLPVWRRGPQLNFCSYGERTETWDYGKMVSSEWNAFGKKNHPILSRILKHPSYQLPIWLSFYCFNNDIYYKTKWSDDDYRYEFPSHFTLVFFGLCISLTAYIPKANENDFTCNDDYWESLLTYRHYGGDLKATNDVMGYWNTVGEDKFRFRFQPRFLSSQLERDELISIQEKCLKKLKRQKKKEEKEKSADK